MIVILCHKKLTDHRDNILLSHPVFTFLLYQKVLPGKQLTNRLLGFRRNTRIILQGNAALQISQFC